MKRNSKYNRFRWLVLAVFILFNISISAEFPQPEIIWEFDCGGPLVGTPVFYPSVNAPEAVITLMQTGEMVCVNKNGKLLWRVSLGGPAQATPAVGDLDGDGIPEIVTGTVAGEVVVLNSQGKELWRFPLAGRINDWSSPCLPDLDGDGKREILIGDDQGWMNCLSGQGKRIWRMHADPHTTSSAAIVPGPDGHPDYIVYGNENDHIIALSTSGELRWVTEQESQFGRTNPTVGDLDGDGDYEIILHTSFNNVNSRVFALNAEDGRVLWIRRVNLHGYVSSAIADIDGDGSNEVVIPLRSNTIYCFNGDGRERWHTITGGNAFYWTPAVADLNGDGHCEIVAGVRRINERGKSWFVLDNQGQLLGEYEMPGGANGAPLVADLDRDGRLDIVLPGSDKGLLRCITFGGPSQGVRLEWVSHRYNSERLGYVPAKKKYKIEMKKNIVPSELDVQLTMSPHWGSNILKISDIEINSERAILELSNMDPQGRKVSYLHHYHRGEFPDRINVDLVGTGKHLISVRLWDTADWNGPQASWKGEISLADFETYIDSLRKKLNGLTQVSNLLLKSAPSLARLLQERYTLRMGSLQNLSNKVEQIDFNYSSDADAVLKHIKHFSTILEEDFALVELAQATAEQFGDTPLVIWEDPNPWDEKIPILESPNLLDDIQIKVPLYRGEYESRALTLVNLRPENLSVQVRMQSEFLQALSVYEVIAVPRQDGIWVRDALAEMNGARILRLAPGETRQLWITVNGKRFDAGMQELSMEFVPLGWEGHKIALKILAEVRSLDLQQAPPFYVCNWSSPQGLQGAGVDPAEIMVAREHGVNVYVFGMPGRICDNQGSLLDQADWTSFDRNLDLLGDDCFLLISGQGVTIPKEVKRFDPVHVKAQRAWLQEIRRHLENKGWPIDRWALYPVDEPGLFGGTLIKRFVEIASHLKESMPDIPIYANPAGFVTVENMQGMVPLVDVWCPQQAMLRRQAELAPFFLATGKRVWCYEAPPEVKTLYPLGYYRALSWMAFQLNLSGAGFWTQFYGDLWLRGVQAEYGANYIVSGKEVISRRFEAFRDGIEDVRAFFMLEEAVAKAKEANVHVGEVKEAEKILTEDIKDVTRVAWECNDIKRFLRDYEMDYPEILRIRNRIANLTTLLGK